MTTSPRRQPVDRTGLTASLPSGYMREAEKRSSEPQNILHRSLTVSPSGRPRSSSIQGGKRSLRLPKGRSSSFRLPHRRKSEGEEASTGTVTLDSAFARTRQQLANLTAEDQSLKERVDKLSEDINDLYRAVSRKQRSPLRQRSDKIARHLLPTLMVSSSREKILLDPAWGTKEPLSSNAPSIVHRESSSQHTCVLTVEDIDTGSCSPASSGDELFFHDD